MLVNEAKWIGAQISNMHLTKDSVFLNFGSQTLKYNNENKHIIDFVITPLRQKCQLKNLDIVESKEIDYAGDIMNDQFFNKLVINSFDGVLLCNVLEHVTNIEGLTRRVGKLIKPGGFLLFTGPFEYPIHYDPIDNGFRPKVDEVVNLFKGFKTIQSGIVEDYTYSFYLKQNRKHLLYTLLRLMMPFFKYKKWKDVVLPKFTWWNRQFKVTCVLMQKGE